MDDLHVRVAGDAEIVNPLATRDMALIDIREEHRTLTLSLSPASVDRLEAACRVARGRMERSHARADLHAMRAITSTSIGRNGQ